MSSLVYQPIAKCGSNLALISVRSQQCEIIATYFAAAEKLQHSTVAERAAQVQGQNSDKCSLCIAGGDACAGGFGFVGSDVLGGGILDVPGLAGDAAGCGGGALASAGAAAMGGLLGATGAAAG